MKEKLDIIADNLHLKGWMKYFILVIFLIIVFLFLNKIFSFEKKDEIDDIVFKLNGSKIVTLYEYDDVNDLGVTALFNGRDISSTVKKIGNVDTSQTGIYDIIYKLNTNGSEFVLERTYVVIANEGAYIELIGNKVINLGVGSKYVEPGYVAIDYVNGDVTDKVEVTNNINFDVPGEYLVNYSFVGSDDEVKTASRIVRVHSILPNSLELSLNGDDHIDLLVGTVYNEPGYKAIDEGDGDITENVVVSSDLNVNVPGTYIIRYSITNSIGIQKTKSRVIQVYKKQEGILNFVLNGDLEMRVTENSKFVEPGYMAIDTVDGNITNKVVVKGVVDTSKCGTYILRYYISNSSGSSKELIRKVNVVARKSGDISFVLLGNNPLLIDNGGTFIEPGYRAIDTIDGDISSDVIVSGDVNVNLPGTYNIKYTVSNSTGKTKTAVREVIVARDLVITLTNQTKGYSGSYVDVLVEVSGDGFKELVLPDGSVVNSKKMVYKVQKNGEAVFKAYNLNNREFVNSIKISNIDSTGPTGSCQAIVNSSKTTISVSGIDNQSGLNEYQYIVDGYSTSRTNNSSYVYSSSASSVYVNLFDNVGNSSKIRCNITEVIGKNDTTNKNDTSGSSDKVTSGNSHVTGYWIYAPDNYKTKKYPLLVFLHGGGRRGNDISLLEDYTFANYTKNGKKYNAVILMPQMQGEKWSDTQTMSELKNLIDDIINKYNVDSHRISISGHSLGGIGTYAMVAKYPNFFAAAAPISGRYPESYASALSKTPIWAIHGALDTNVSYDADRDLISKIKSAGGEAQLTTFERYGHGIVDKALSETDVINWLITSRR